MLPTIDITGTSLVTERLILRPWRETDITDFFEYASVPGVGEEAGWPHHESIETSKIILESFMREKNVFAIADRKTNKVIGSLGFHDTWANRDERFSGKRVCEIGYVLSKAFWGCGLMTEAVSAAIDYAFSEMKLYALFVCHFTGNDRSRRVIEKSGFTPISTGVFHAKQLGVDFEEIRYILKNPLI